MNHPNNIYQRVVDVTTYYLGPAADRFVSRQVYNHLDKQPETLHKEDLKELINWLQIAMAFITDDIGLVDKYSKDLQALAKNKPGNGTPHGGKFIEAS